MDAIHIWHIGVFAFAVFKSFFVVKACHGGLLSKKSDVQVVQAGYGVMALLFVRMSRSMREFGFLKLICSTKFDPVTSYGAFPPWWKVDVTLMNLKDQFFVFYCSSGDLVLSLGLKISACRSRSVIIVNCLYIKKEDCQILTVDFFRICRGVRSKKQSLPFVSLSGIVHLHY